MLWCRDSSRYRVYDCVDLFEYGVAGVGEWEEAEGCHCHDDAKADAFQVPSHFGGIIY